MNKGLKRLISVVVVLVIVGTLIFLTVFLLAKQKKILYPFGDNSTCNNIKYTLSDIIY